MIKQLKNSIKRLNEDLDWHKKNTLHLEILCNQLSNENDKLIEALTFIANLEKTIEEKQNIIIIKTPSLESVKRYAGEVLKEIQNNNNKKEE